MVCMVSGVRFWEADTCMLYPLVFNCRGGGWYVMCAKSVAVTWPCAHCFHWLPTSTTDSWIAEWLMYVISLYNSDVCHTAVILDAAYGNIQQPAHNLVAV